jgi:diaminopimelate epimerase
MRFTKMHSLGNDFMVLDGINQSFELHPAQVRSWANRHTGVGFDQCLLLETSSDPKVDFFYKIYNADGTEVGQCGNGARCLARFVQHHGLSDKKTLTIATKTTKFQVTLHDDDVSVQFSPAQFLPQQIPLSVAQEQARYSIPLKQGQTQEVHSLSVGNPHAVLCVPSVQDAPVSEMGKEISEHARFPEQTNVEFIELNPPHRIKCRVYERGCGETLACGSGAVAAAVIARKFYDFEPHIQVLLPGGSLTVHCPDPAGTIELSGPAVFVYEGELM